MTERYQARQTRSMPLFGGPQTWLENNVGKGDDRLADKKGDGIHAGGAVVLSSRLPRAG